MQPFFSAAGVDVTGKVARFAKEHGVNPENVSVMAVEETPTGERLGIALKLSDGSTIGVLLTPTEVEAFLERAARALKDLAVVDGTLAPTPKLQLVRDPEGMH